MPKEIHPVVLQMLAAGITSLEALTKVDTRLEMPDAIRFHYPTVTGLPHNECVRSWLGDTVAQHCAPGPLLVSAEHDVSEGGVEKFTHRDFKMADLAAVRKVLESMSDKGVIHSMDASCSKRMAVGGGFMKG